MHTFFLQCSKGIDALTRWVGYGAMGAIFLVVLVSSLNALSRYAFGITSNAFLELQWYLFGGAFMLAGADTLRRSEHVRVDAVYGKFSARAKGWIDIGALALIVIPMSVFIGYMALPMFIDSFVSGEMSNDYGGLIRYPVKFVIPAGFGLIALQAVSEIIKTVHKMRTSTEQEKGV